MGTFRQSRTPREDTRSRRNSQQWGNQFAITVADGGLETDADGALQISLASDPGLALSASGLTVVVAAPVQLDGSGVGLNTGDGLTLSSGALIADLGDGMTIVSGAIEPNPGDGIVVGSTIAVELAADAGLGFSGGALTAQVTSPITLSASGIGLNELELSFVDPGGDLVVQSYADADRPTAGTPGRIIFNTDDGQLNVDDGTDWTLPDGTTT